MYHIPFLITPALVCLFWIFVHGLLAARTLTFRLIIILFSFIVLAILGDVILTVIMGLEETNELLARIHSRSFSVNDPANSFLNQLYCYWAVLLLQLVMAAEMAFMVGFILVMSIKLHLRPGVFTNLLRGKRIRVLQAQIILTGSIFLIICLKLAMHAAPFHDDPVWALSFAGVHAILYFLFGFFALFSAKEYISWHDITTAFRFNYKPETQSGVAEEIITDMSGLLSDVAERLHTNKTYVSKMVNQTYKMGFPELLSILRVDYAQRYIRSHPDASQEEIAKASGFLSASTFNCTFKRISGFTPKVWKARKDSIAGR